MMQHHKDQFPLGQVFTAHTTYSQTYNFIYMLLCFGYRWMLQPIYTYDHDEG